MKALTPQELRIGNYVSSLVNNRPLIKVLQLFGDSYQGDFGNGSRGGIMYENSEGIPLDEKWLIKFRFDKHPISWSKDISYFPKEEYKALCVTINQGLIVRCGHQNDPREKDEIMVLWNNDVRGPLCVHVLQNAWYILTGEELTISSSNLERG
jgi:hypothetical protein